MKERVAVFIDGSNFYHGAKRSGFEYRINFHKFSTELAKGRNLIRTYYYTAPLNQKDDPDGYRRQQKFFQSLHNAESLTLKLGRLEKRGGTYVEKGVDVAIAVDMMAMAHSNSIDVFYLVSADADFVPVVEEIKRLGKKVFNVYFAKGVSYHLRGICDGFVPVTGSFIDVCRLSGNSSVGQAPSS